MHRYFISAAIFGLAASPALAVCVADMRAKSGTGAVSGQYYLAVVSNDQCVVAQAQSTIDRQGSGKILSTSNLRQNRPQTYANPIFAGGLFRSALSVGRCSTAAQAAPKCYANVMSDA